MYKIGVRQKANNIKSTPQLTRSRHATQTMKILSEGGIIQ